MVSKKEVSVQSLMYFGVNRACGPSYRPSIRDSWPSSGTFFAITARAIGSLTELVEVIPYAELGQR